MLRNWTIEVGRKSMMSENLADKTLTIEQIRSPLRRDGSQRQTLIGLGLNKMRRERTLKDTPSARGMIKKVKHLIRIVSE